MSIRRRTWTTRRGEDREAWIADYFDQNGERHIKTFKLKSEAKEFASRTHVEVKEGIHVADSATVTVGEAAGYWLDSCKERPLEPSSIARNSQHVELHIKPFLGKTKLSKLSIPAVRAFQTKLSEEGRSPAMVKGVLVSLSSILTDAQERGLAIRNPVRELSRSRKGSRSNGRDKIQVGVDIPTPREIKIVTEGAKNLRHKVSIMVLATTGLRASEFRALQWPDLDLVHNELHVRRRADDKNRIGPPKSRAGTRTIPLIPQVGAVLKHWKKECPTKDGELLYVFPNGNGNIENYGNVADRIWERAQLDAEVTVPATDEDGNVLKGDKGQPLMAPKYTGLHSLRHFFISWCINRKKDGGLELLPKTVQERAGHSDIKLLFDTYGHLFPRANDKAELTKAGSKLFG